MPQYLATFGADAPVYFTLGFEAADEHAAIAQAIALWRDRHATQRLTLVDESARRWRIDDLVRLDVRHQPDWDEGLVCEAEPLDDEARLAPIEAEGAALLRLVATLLNGLHQPHRGRPWWTALDPATTRQIVDVLSRIDRDTRLDTAVAVLPAIDRLLDRLAVSLPAERAGETITA
jgi:hypothetical protein